MRTHLPRWTNKIPLAVALLFPGLPVGTVFAFWYWASPEYTDVGYTPEQPVPFSHKLHAGELKMDCRYCHNVVERGAKAAIPPTNTCMNCHKLVKPKSEKLALVRQSFDEGTPVEWVKVHMLPDYAYFDHSVHLAGGVGCVECHGRIDRMEVVGQQEPLSMGWCLECHRNPEPRLRPVSEITNMTWRGYDAYDPKKDPKRKRQVKPPTHCSGCHR